MRDPVSERKIKLELVCSGIGRAFGLLSKSALRNYAAAQNRRTKSMPRRQTFPRLMHCKATTFKLERARKCRCGARRLTNANVRRRRCRLASSTAAANLENRNRPTRRPAGLARSRWFSRAAGASAMHCVCVCVCELCATPARLDNAMRILSSR